MSFGNFHLHRLEPTQRQESNQRNAFGRSFERPGSSGRRIESLRQSQPVRESFAGFSGKSKTDLTVITAEGDRVTISLAAQVQYAESSKTGPNGSSQTVASSTASQLRVAVEGNLNETELKDLGKLLSSLAQATGQTQSTGAPNNSPPATDTTDTGFANLTSLAAFAYSFKQTVEAGTLVYSKG